MRGALFACSSLFLASALCSGLAGCSSGPKTIVKGKVVRNGKPIPGKLKITFYPIKNGEEDRTKPQEAAVNPDGTFEVTGKGGGGIPVGPYRICMWNFAERTKGSSDLGDQFKGAFAPGKSPIIRDIVPDQPELVIDVSKPKG